MFTALKQGSRKIAACCAMASLLFAASAAQAADVTMILSNPGNTSWETATSWSDGQVAHAGDDYFVGIDRAGADILGKVMRTPMVDCTFPGKSVTIGKTGTLAIKPGVRYATQLNTFSNLFMTTGSTMSQYSDDTTGTILGKMQLSDAVTFNTAGANVRGFYIKAQITGAGTLRFTQDHADNNDFVVFDNNTNTYSGEIEQTGGIFRLASATPITNVTKLTLKDSVNSANTILDPDADVVALSTDLVIAAKGKVKLDKKINFKTVTVNGTALANGYYTAAALQTSYAANFTNDGGALIVGTPTPLITVNPASAVTFSDINVMIQAGDKNAKTVTITNNGALPLNFIKQGAETNQGLVLAGSPLFTIASILGNTATPLAPGDSITVNLQFGVAARTDYSATGSNAKAATLTIYTNATNQATTTINLSGNTAVPVEMSGFAAE